MTIGLKEIQVVTVMDGQMRIHQLMKMMKRSSLINILNKDKIQANKLYTLSFNIATATLNLKIGGGDLTGNEPDEEYITATNYAVGSHNVTFTPTSSATHLWITAFTESAGNGTIDNVTLIKNGLTKQILQVVLQEIQYH